MKKNLILSAIMLSISMSSQAKTECSLASQESGNPCASVEETFDAALKNEGNPSNVFGATNPEKEEEVSSNEFEILNIDPSEPVALNEEQKATKQKKQVTQKTKYQHFGDNVNNKAVYIPEKLHRIYISQYQTKSGALVSGKTIYYRTPGHFASGNLRINGVVGKEMLAPSTPDDLGFQPSESSIKKQVINQTGAPTNLQSIPQMNTGE